MFQSLEYDPSTCYLVFTFIFYFFKCSKLLYILNFSLFCFQNFFLSMLFLWNFYSKNCYLIIQAFILFYWHPICSNYIFLQIFQWWPRNSLQSFLYSFFSFSSSVIFFSFLFSSSCLSITSKLDYSSLSLPYGWTLKSATFSIFYLAIANKFLPMCEIAFTGPL